MKLVDLKVKEYLDILISDEPAPGGGSVSALAGSGCSSAVNGLRSDYNEEKVCR